MGPNYRPHAQFLDHDDLELRSVLMVSLLQSLHPVAHRFVTPALIDVLMAAVHEHIDKMLALEDSV